MNDWMQDNLIVTLFISVMGVGVPFDMGLPTGSMTLITVSIIAIVISLCSLLFGRGHLWRGKP